MRKTRSFRLESGNRCKKLLKLRLESVYFGMLTVIFLYPSFPIQQMALGTSEGLVLKLLC